MKTIPTAQPKLYIGIDIHKRSWKIHCATELFSGKSFTMPPKPELLRDYFHKHFSGHEVTTAYEAGCCGYYAHRSFEGVWLAFPGGKPCRYPPKGKGEVHQDR